MATLPSSCHRHMPPGPLRRTPTMTQGLSPQDPGLATDARPLRGGFISAAGKRTSVRKCAWSLHLCPALCDPMDQAPLSVGISRQEYWSGLPFPSPGGLPDPGMEPTSLMSPALAGGLFTARNIWEAHTIGASTQGEEAHSRWGGRGSRMLAWSSAVTCKRAPRLRFCVCLTGS